MSMLTGQGNQLAVTPYRKTRVRFDLPTTTVLEPAFAITRKGNQIGAGSPPLDLKSHNVEQLAHGGWTLKPVNEDRWIPASNAPADSGIIRKSEMTTAPGLVERYAFRKATELSGVGFTSAVAARGNPFIGPANSQTQGWGQELATDVTVVPKPLEFDIAPDAPQRNILREMYTNFEREADGGLLVRFYTEGTGLEAVDVLLRIYFGGPAASDENGAQIGGHFILSLLGNGDALLFEQVVNEWVRRFTFRWCEADQVGGSQHAIRIRPFLMPSGRAGGLEFRTRLETRQTSGLAVTNRVAMRGAASPGERVSLYRFAFPPSHHRTQVTGPGKVRVDRAADQRVFIQVSVPFMPLTGLVVDSAFSTDFYASPGSPLTLAWKGVTPEGTTLTGALYDALTGDELTMESETGNSKTYTYPAGKWLFFPQFTLTTDEERRRAPILSSYTVKRDGVLGSTADNEVEEFSHAAVRYSVTGPERDPSHETASCTLQDVLNEGPKLRRRAMIPAQIETEWDPEDSDRKMTLFRGYLGRADATKRGKIGMSYPSPEWRRLDCTFVGQWAQLKRAISFVGFDFGSDPDSPDHAYKVTDVIRIALSWAGFTSDEIYVQDHPIRLENTPDQNEDSLLVWPGQTVFDLVTQLLRDYLGWPIFWAGNQGEAGRWYVAPLPAVDADPIAEFRTYGPDQGVVSRPESYGTDNWVGQSVTTFITKDKFRTYMKPPEANMVIVSTTGDLTASGDEARKSTCWAVNEKSYDFYTYGDGERRRTADPNHPDYLGTFVPVVVVDPSLGIGADSAAVLQWVTRRIFNLACRAVKMFNFEAPLVGILESEEPDAKPRPLRYGDPITVNGFRAILRSCNPVWRKDELQMAVYEAETNGEILGAPRLAFDTFTQSAAGSLLEDHSGEEQLWGSFTEAACLSINSSKRIYVGV